MSDIVFDEDHEAHDCRASNCFGYNDEDDEEAQRPESGSSTIEKKPDCCEWAA